MALESHGLTIAFELYDLGQRLVATRYRRENPEATDSEVAARIREWTLDRPGAPLGDADGVPRQPATLN